MAVNGLGVHYATLLSRNKELHGSITQDRAMIEISHPDTQMGLAMR